MIPFVANSIFMANCARIGYWETYSCAARDRLHLEGSYLPLPSYKKNSNIAETESRIFVHRSVLELWTQVQNLGHLR